MSTKDLTKSEATNLVRFVMGVEIIRRYELDAEMSANHGFIYVGNYELSHTKMMPLEKQMMKALGWVEADESWSFYV
ncbi:hypothetical protein GS682_04790 [Nostoc sp. B(2019)]|nr:hypothetical protein [Nostoc sp. B(2019)]